MDGDGVVLDPAKPVRRRRRKPKSKAFSNVAYLFTTTLSSYKVPVYVSKEAIEGDAVGYWDEECHEIAVRLPAPSDAAEADRMIHEHIHAISTLLLPPDGRLSELQVNTVSTALVDLLMRNRDLRDFVVSRLGPLDAPSSVPDPPDGPRGSSGSSRSVSTETQPAL